MIGHSAELGSSMIAEVSGQTISSVETAGVLLEKKKKELRGLLLLQLAQKISSEKSSKIDALIAKEPELSREIAELELRVREEGFLLDEEGQESENQPEPSKGLKERFLKRMRGLFAGGKNWFADYFGSKQRARQRLVDQGEDQDTLTEEALKAEQQNEKIGSRLTKDALAAVAGMGVGLSFSFLTNWLASKGFPPDVVMGLRTVIQSGPLAVAMLLPGGEMLRKWSAQMGVKASEISQFREGSGEIQSQASQVLARVGEQLLSLSEQATSKLSQNPEVARLFFLGMATPVIADTINTLLEQNGIDVDAMTRQAVSSLQDSAHSLRDVPEDMAQAIQEIAGAVEAIQNNPEVMEQFHELVDNFQGTGVIPDELNQKIDTWQDNVGLDAQGQQQETNLVGTDIQPSEADRAQNWTFGFGSSSDQSSASVGTDTGEGGSPSGGLQQIGPKENPDATGNAGAGSSEVTEPNQSVDGANQQIGQEVQAEHQPAITFDREAAEEWQNHPEDPSQRAVITSMADLHESLFNPDGSLNVEEATAFRDHFGIPQTTAITEQTLQDYGTAIHYANVDKWEDLTPEMYAEQQTNRWIFGEDKHSKFNLTVPPGGRKIFEEK